MKNKKKIVLIIVSVIFLIAVIACVGLTIWFEFVRDNQPSDMPSAVFFIKNEFEESTDGENKSGTASIVKYSLSDKTANTIAKEKAEAKYYSLMEEIGHSNEGWFAEKSIKDFIADGSDIIYTYGKSSDGVSLKYVNTTDDGKNKTLSRKVVCSSKYDILRLSDGNYAVNTEYGIIHVLSDGSFDYIMKSNEEYDILGTYDSCVYFSKNKNTLYKVDVNGKISDVLKIDEGDRFLFIGNGWILYRSHNVTDGFVLYNEATKEKIELSEIVSSIKNQQLIPVNIDKDGTMTFLTIANIKEGRSVFRITKDNKLSKSKAKIYNYSSVAMSENWVYYVDAADKSLKRTNFDSVETCLETPVAGIQCHGNWIYYVNKEDNKLYRISDDDVTSIIPITECEVTEDYKLEF